MSSLHIYILFQSILLALLCFFSKTQSDKRYLGLFFFSFSAQAVYVLVAHDRIWLNSHFYWAAVSKSMSMLAPGLLYLHTKQLSGKADSPYDGLLFVPAVAYFVAFFWFYTEGYFTSLNTYLASPFFFFVQIATVIYTIVLIVHWTI